MTCPAASIRGRQSRRARRRLVAPELSRDVDPARPDIDMMTCSESVAEILRILNETLS